MLVKQSILVFTLLLGMGSVQATRITTYNGPTRITSSGMKVQSGIIAHRTLPYGTIVEVKFKRSVRRYIVADRGPRGSNWDVWHPHAGPGVLPDYGRTRIVSRGVSASQWRHMNSKARLRYLRGRLKQCSIGIQTRR